MLPLFPVTGNGPVTPTEARITAWYAIDLAFFEDNPSMWNVCNAYLFEVCPRRSTELVNTMAYHYGQWRALQCLLGF